MYSGFLYTEVFRLVTEDTNGGPQGCRRLYSPGPRDPRDVIKVSLGQDRLQVRPFP